MAIKFSIPFGRPVVGVIRQVNAGLFGKKISTPAPKPAPKPAGSVHRSIY